MYFTHTHKLKNKTKDEVSLINKNNSAFDIMTSSMLSVITNTLSKILRFLLPPLNPDWKKRINLLHF